MLTGLGDAHGGPVCVTGASGVTGLEVFTLVLQCGHSEVSCNGLKSVVACSLALGMLMGDLFVSLEHLV